MPKSPLTRFEAMMDRKGWTITRLAVRINYSPFAVRSWRQGVRTPQRGALVQIAKALRVTLDELDGAFDRN
jgi:transcriptional regulator with XRE-family HTH domain